GDPVSAAGCVLTSFSLARSLDDEPVLYSQLHAANIRMASCDRLERILCRASLPEATLSQLEQMLVLSDRTNQFVASLVGERALAMEYMRQSQEDRGIFWKWRGIVAPDRAFYLRAMETNINIVAVGPPKSLAMTNELQKIHQELKSSY